MPQTFRYCRVELDEHQSMSLAERSSGSVSPLSPDTGGRRRLFLAYELPMRHGDLP